MSEPKNIHASALEVLGGFTRVQELIDQFLVPRYFETKNPAMAEFLTRKLTDRVSDKDRKQMVTRIAKDIGSDADLSNFESTFSQAKAIRDRIAHSITTVTEVGLSVVDLSVKGESENNIVYSPETLDDTFRDLDWMFSQIMYVMTSLIDFAALGDQKVKWNRPTRLPKDWDSRYFEIDE